MRDWRAFVRAHLPSTGLSPEREARVVREIASQLEDFEREAIARGASDAEAARYAEAQVVDWRRLAEDVGRADRAHRRARLDDIADSLEFTPASRARGGLMLANFLRDGRYAVRQLFKTPGFTLVATLTIALGIGATTAIFSVVNGVLLRPLPYPEPGELVRVHEVLPQYGLFAVAPANFLDWRQQNTVFDSLGAYGSGSRTFAFADGPERVPGAVASADLFQVLGTRAALGSTFTAEEDAPGAPPVIVLSHGLWQDRFGADPAIVGRTVTVNGTPTTVVGVMPAGFYFPSRAAQFWLPLGIDPANAPRGAHFLGVVARMKPGVTTTQASSAMKGIAERLAKEYPNSSAGESARVVLLQDQIVGSIRPALLTLFAAVGVLVLIACANVANLLLVRASVREREVAIRMALGAGRGRLTGQMLAESLVLAVMGGGLGVALGYLALAPIRTLGASSLPRVADITIDGTVLLVAMGASVLTGLLFGLAPAWQATRSAVGTALKEGGRSSSTSGGRWVRSTLLVVEVALSIVLLTGAVLLLRSFDRLTSVDTGFKADGVLAFQISLPSHGYAEAPQVVGFYDRLLGRLDAQPGVETAGLVQTLPLRGGYFLTFDVRGRPKADPAQQPSAHYRVISAGYFTTLGVPILKGRAFTPQDRSKTEMVAVVDQAFAEKFFPNEDPIGQGLDIDNGTDGFYDVVGVVGNMRYDGLDATPAPTMYVPYTQDSFSTMWVVARTTGAPGQLVGPVRGIVKDLDPSLPTYSMNPLTTIVSDSVAPQRFSTLLLGLFASVALFLSAVGLYGVVAYTVSQRTREIGLRMAIGAEPRHVLRLVVGGGLRLALVGVAIGLVGALALSRLVRTLLFEVAPSDPVSYAVTAGLLVAVALLACYVPARRAMRVDPLVALQEE